MTLIAVISVDMPNSLPISVLRPRTLGSSGLSPRVPEHWMRLGTSDRCLLGPVLEPRRSAVVAGRGSGADKKTELD
jgi:hypothetical protein